MEELTFLIGGPEMLRSDWLDGTSCVLIGSLFRVFKQMVDVFKTIN
jgi:hypothetical protein